MRACAPYKTNFWEVIGRFPAPNAPMNARSRRIETGKLNGPLSPSLSPSAGEREKNTRRGEWTVYEVVLDVLPDVFAWGYLLVPEDLKRVDYGRL